MILALLVRVATFGTEKKKCPGLIVPVVLPTVDNEVTEVLTKEEMARLLKVLQAGTYTDKKGVVHVISRDAIDIVYLAISTGMRRGEILGIEWKNVDYQAETILVPHPKERRRKHVHINRIVLDVLKSREGNGSRFVFPARDWKEKDGHITDPKRSLHVIKRAAGLPGDFRPCHSYRHVWATTALTPVEDGGAGIDIYTVSKSLGHRSIETTERYLTLIDKSKKSALDRVAAIFAPKELLPANVVPITKVSS
jgi:integrase